LTAGQSTVTASINGSSKTAAVTFVADITTAKLSVASDRVNNVVADGIDSAQITATVSDANGNTLSNYAVTFSATNSGVIPANGTTDSNGEVVVTLTNVVAGTTNVTAGIDSGGTSVTKNISVIFIGDSDNLSATNSSLTASPATIVADGSTASTVTLTLRDSNSNPVSGQTVTLASSLAGTTAGSVTDNGDGTYTAQLTGMMAGTTSVTAQVGGSAFNVSAVQVTLTALPPQPVPAATTLSANGYSFASNSSFPQTGFTGATFKVQLNGNTATNSNYTWSANQAWVNVDGSGNVSFIGTATSGTKNVIITATPKAGGAALTYSFSVNKWFTNAGSTFLDWSNASSYCSTRGGVPSISEVSSGQNVRGTIGVLYAEWGSLLSYVAGFDGNYYYWLSDMRDAVNHRGLIVDSGFTSSNNTYNSMFEGVLCRQGL
ncbi:Ig-like domain-containing protein, partial [Enterobacter hormaechei]|uniref:Ig-like domain-containing protein n=1 Tax=Enterobacter hormaechei TaxID=158836 RepID=UPI000AB6A40E